MKIFNYIAVIILLSLLLVSCKNDTTVLDKLISNVEPSIEHGKNIELIYSEDAIVQAKISAPTIERHMGKADKMVFPDGIKVLFYSNSVNTSELTANEAEKLEKEDRISMRGNVKVINADGKTLETDELVYDRRRGKISSDKIIKVRNGDEVIIAESFESNEDLTKMVFRKIINSYISVKK